MNKDKIITKSWIENVDLHVPEPSEPYYERKDYSVHCSCNYYYTLLDHLPCGWIGDWYGWQAKELIEPIKLSMAMIESHPMKYEKYLAFPERSLEAMNECYEILLTCLEHFEEAPDLIIDVY